MAEQLRACHHLPQLRHLASFLPDDLVLYSDDESDGRASARDGAIEEGTREKLAANEPGDASAVSEAPGQSAEWMPPPVSTNADLHLSVSGVESLSGAAGGKISLDSGSLRPRRPGSILLEGPGFGRELESATDFNDSRHVPPTADDAEHPSCPYGGTANATADLPLAPPLFWFPLL